MTHLEPKIYVACLAAYNNGYLHGEWINANQDVDDLYLEIKKILASSPVPDAEEWAIHDYEDFGSLQVSEYASLETISTLASFIAEHNELGAAVLTYAGGDVGEAGRLLEEAYHGEFNSEEDFAMSFAEETMSVPENLSYYIDYEKMARDLFINDFFSIEVENRVHVFSYS